MGRLVAVLVLATGLAVAGCYPEPTTLNVLFPTEQSFLYSDNAQVVLFNLGETETNVCPALIDQVRDEIGSRESTMDFDVPVCDLRNGGVSFEDIGEGTRGFVVVTRDQVGSRPLLYGCITTQTSIEGPDITLSLQFTSGYNDIVEDLGELGCRSIDEKCSRGCG